MPRRWKPVPSYRHHKQSGQAIVTVRLLDGKRKDILLRRYGTPESRAEYQRVLAQLDVSPDAAVARTMPPASDLTVNELLLAFWKHAQEYYRRPDGSTTNELVEYRLAFRPVRELYGHIPAGEFGPLALRAVRQRWIDAGLCRTQVNRRVGRVRRAWRWGASEQLVAAAALQALATVPGLRRGRCGVREPEPIGPVTEEHARAVLPFVRPEVAAMIEVQLLCGCRPAEVCAIRPANVDTSGPVWQFRPAVHKSSWRGRPRVIALGPRAQAVLGRFWPADPSAFVFSPRRAVEAQHKARSEGRVTPLFPSHARRNVEKRVGSPARLPAECYTAPSYGRAVERGVKRCNAARKKSGLPPVPHWRPNRLRHTLATQVRQRFGLEAAQVALGHSRADVTQLYAQRDQGLATRVALELG